MFEKRVLGMEQAMAALNAMIEEAAKEPERPLAFAIVDDHGDLICFARMDQTNPIPHALALKKAYTSARMRSDTLALAERMKAQGRSISDLGDPNMVSVQGGIVIMGESGPLGGIGVSGRRADEDEVIARVGLAALGL
ncbi:MAG: heme-binding protein [Chloroflexi bacterium]|nr:heme-binding protein [Chloroflexota bacterium]